MTVTSWARRWGLFVLALALSAPVAVPIALPAQAAEKNPFDASIASTFLQSRAQIRIYRHDDQADLTCQSRSFVTAQVVRKPHVVDDKLNERKWIERWVMDRCGDQVTYDVYFTEVGKGGAIFTFLEVR